MGIDWIERKLQRGFPGGLAAYPDCNCLYQLRYGYRYPGDPADTVTVVAPLASAMPHLADIAAQFRTELRPDALGAPPKYRALSHPVAWPFRAHAVGIVFKNGKGRPVTDAGSPHDRYVDGRPVSMNAAADAADEEIPDGLNIQWVQTVTFLEQAEVIYAHYDTLRTVEAFQLEPAALAHLQPTSFSTDRSAFYRQFAVCNRDAHMSGVLVPLLPPGALERTDDPEEAKRKGLKLLDTDYVPFGPCKSSGLL